VLKVVARVDSREVCQVVKAGRCLQVLRVKPVVKARLRVAKVACQVVAKARFRVAKVVCQVVDKPKCPIHGLLKRNNILSILL